MKKHLVSDRSAGYGGRVTKYKHRFCNTEFGPLKFSKQELGIICVLLLRGPQTPGELRARTQSPVRVYRRRAGRGVLSGLLTREDGPFIARLARAAGARESRYAHLFSGVIESAPEPAAAAAAARRARRRAARDLESRNRPPGGIGAAAAGADRTAQEPGSLSAQAQAP